MQVIVASDLVQTGYVKPDLPVVKVFLVEPDTGYVPNCWSAECYWAPQPVFFFFLLPKDFSPLSSPFETKTTFLFHFPCMSTQSFQNKDPFCIGAEFITEIDGCDTTT
jgi:hypothetical protein